MMALYESISGNSMEYRDAVDRAICIPGCKVVPYFGAFLRELQCIFEENSPVVAVPESTDKVSKKLQRSITLRCLICFNFDDYVHLKQSSTLKKHKYGTYVSLVGKKLKNTISTFLLETNAKQQPSRIAVSWRHHTALWMLQRICPVILTVISVCCPHWCNDANVPFSDKLGCKNWIRNLQFS